MPRQRNASAGLTQLAEMLPPGWDRRPLTIAGELEPLLQTMADEGTQLHAGCWSSGVETYVVIGGVSIRIVVELDPRKLEARNVPRRR